MMYKDSLWLYRSMRGISLLKSMHQKITKVFGDIMARLLYSKFLMTLLHHHMNWKSSEHNRSYLTQVLHYNGFPVGCINELYESIFGFPVYVNWGISTKYMVETFP